MRRLELFGSATGDRYRPESSDIDLLVEFFPLSGRAYADAYFGLHESLVAAFAAPVDLVVASAIRNPYFKASIDQQRTLLYAA